MLTKVLTRHQLGTLRQWTLPASSRTLSSESKSKDYDFAIVGGGIVGLATAQELIHRYPEKSFILLEKESVLSQHQTGHNSGVIHAGIYYKPGSLTAKLCVEGLLSTYKYCDAHNLSYNKCGKLVVARNADEETRLLALFDRAKQNQVPGISLVGPDEIQQIEPECRGLRAIHSPETGIVDWGLVARHYGKVFQDKGGQIVTGFEVQEINPKGSAVEIRGGDSNQPVSAKHVLTCAGLYSDRIAKLTGCPDDPKIVPFRGEYLLLNAEMSKKIKGNIYPVPDPRFPFLGFHFTPRMNGEVWLGPNAVLAFAREGYKWSDLKAKDLTEVLAYPGFYKLAKKYLSFGSYEVLRSIFISLAVKELRTFVPTLKSSDVTRGPAGVRAMAMNADGDLIPEFIFDAPPPETGLAGRVLHCRNAPSPAATSSLAIARVMADKVVEEFQLPHRQRAKLY